jgi:GNAT superfamily N-acetyltransferase
MNCSIRRVQEATDLEKVYGLFKSCFVSFANITPGEFRKKWEWKYGRKPFVSRDKLPCWGVFANGQLAGFVGRMYVPVKIGSSRCTAAWECDIMVHPDHRRKGLGTLLSATWIHDTDVSLILNLNEKSYPLRKAEGWDDIKADQLMVRVLNLKKATKELVHTVVGKKRGAVCYSDRHYQDESLRLENRRFARIRQVQSFDARVDELWSKCSGENVISVVKNLDYLTWRYRYRDDYRMFILEEGGRVAGLAVLRFMPIGGMTYGVILELMCEPGGGVFDELVSFCVQYCRTSGSDGVSVMGLNSRMRLHLMKKGFFPHWYRPKFLAKTAGAMKDNTKLFEASRWRLTGGDADLYMMPSRKALASED